MRRIPESEAQADLDRILDDVERGESVLIIRNGVAIARIIPAPQESGPVDEGLKGIPQGLEPL
jgi:prevent-host-death family protein